MRKINLVILVGGLALGGSERQLYLTLKYLDKTTFDCHVIVFNSEQDYFIEHLKSLNVRIWKVPQDCKGIVGRMRFVYRILRQVQADIVHSWTFHDNPYAGVVGWFARVPVRLGSNRSLFLSRNVRSLNWLFRFLSLYTVSHIVVNSKAALQEMSTGGAIASRLVFLPNMIETSINDGTNLSDTTLTSLGFDKKCRIIGTVGNLRREKNQLMFVESLSLVLRDIDNARGLIIGQSAPDEPAVLVKILDKIETLGLQGKVIYAGSRPDAPALMKHMAIFCLTSDFEGTPNVILEAMAAGCPIVATRVGDVPDLIEDGITGLLIEPGDVEGLARAVRYLLLNPKEAQRMGQAGRARLVSQFNCDRTVKQLEALYRGALSKKGSPPFSSPSEP